VERTLSSAAGSRSRVAIMRLTRARTVRRLSSAGGYRPAGSPLRWQSVGGTRGGAALEVGSSVLEHQIDQLVEADVGFVIDAGLVAGAVRLALRIALLPADDLAGLGLTVALGGPAASLP
jgi:hypothetical protein